MCVHAAVGQQQKSILSRYEQGFVPRVWQRVQPSCSISGFAFDRRQLYVAAKASLTWGDVCVELRLGIRWYLQAERSITKGWVHGPGGRGGRGQILLTEKAEATARLMEAGRWWQLGDLTGIYW